MHDDAPDAAAASGSVDPPGSASKPEEAPVFTGTLFLTLLFLMLLFGFWVMMYLVLLNR